MRVLAVIASILILASGIEARGERGGNRGGSAASKPPTSAPLDLKIPMACAAQFPKYSGPIVDCVKTQDLTKCLGAMDGAKEFLGGCCDSFKASASPLAQKIVGVCDRVEGFNMSLSAADLPCALQIKQAVGPCIQSHDLVSCAQSASSALKTCCPLLAQGSDSSFTAQIASEACTKLVQYLPGGSTASASATTN
jgi:hypothetical protein